MTHEAVYALLPTADGRRWHRVGDISKAGEVHVATSKAIGFVGKYEDPADAQMAVLRKAKKLRAVA